MRVVSSSVALLALLALSACAAQEVLGPHATSTQNSLRSTPKGAFHPEKSVSGGKIKHVVFVIQENRSFNFLFLGFKGATTQNYGYNLSGKKIMLHTQTMDTDWDIDHSSGAFFSAYNNGKLDGWDKEYACCKVPKNPAYAYGLQSETKTYWDIAEQYVLSDQFFQSNLDGSFIAHQYSVAAYANHEVDYPTGDWGCQGGPSDTIPTLTSNRGIGASVPVCEDYPTLGDELDAAKLPWRSYTGATADDGEIWNAYSAVDHIYSGPDYPKDVITPQSQFFTDIKGGTLDAVTWITPTWADSDHGGGDSTGGPAWVASVVNAVGQSKFWNSTAIFILWDDWGGFFDPVEPIYVDYDGLGFRVPMIAVSPYAKQGYVSHVQYETSSVLRFMEDNFGLAPLAASDSRAADPAGDEFDFTQKPRKFEPFAVPSPPPGYRRRHGPAPAVGGD